MSVAHGERPDLAEVLARFEALARRIEAGDFEGMDEAIARHDADVRAVFGHPGPLDETLARQLLARQHAVNSRLLALRDRLGAELGQQRREHAAARQYLQDAEP